MKLKSCSLRYVFLFCLSRFHIKLRMPVLNAENFITNPACSGFKIWKIIKTGFSCFMRRILFNNNYILIFFLFVFVVSADINLFAENNTLTNAAFTRGGWAGARYTAMGKAAEAIVDDVYSIYWNPAGLRELKQKEALTPEEIRKKVSEGDIDSITEKDLTRFSEDEYTGIFVQVGISTVLLDQDSAVGFAGTAFSFFKGVLGLGYYGWYLKNDGEEASGTDPDNDEKHLASAGYLSYGQGLGAASVGFSLKPVYVDMGEMKFYGLGADLGLQVELIPLVKIGIVMQDIGSGLKPAKNYENTSSEYDFISPTVRLGASITNRSSDFILAVSGIRKLDEGDFDVNFGFQFNAFKFSSLYLGVSSTIFSSGVSVRFLGMDFTYAFLYDNEDFGYTNMLSVTFGI